MTYRVGDDDQLPGSGGVQPPGGARNDRGVLEPPLSVPGVPGGVGDVLPGPAGPKAETPDAGGDAGGGARTGEHLRELGMSVPEVSGGGDGGPPGTFTGRCRLSPEGICVHREKLREKHGRTGTYTNHGCRCEPCCEAMRQQARDWYARNLKVPGGSSRGQAGPCREGGGKTETCRCENVRHGRYATYMNHGCRCEDCSRARLRYDRKANARRARAPRENVPHGTVSGYVSWRCRCRECREVQSRYRANYKLRVRQRRRDAG